MSTVQAGRNRVRLSLALVVVLAVVLLFALVSALVLGSGIVPAPLPVVNVPLEVTRTPVQPDVATITNTPQAPQATNTVPPTSTVTSTPAPTAIPVEARGVEHLAGYAFNIMDRSSCSVENAEWINRGSYDELLAPCQQSPLYQKYLEGKVEPLLGFSGSYIGYTKIGTNDKNARELLYQATPEELCIFLGEYYSHLPEDQGYTQEFIQANLGNRDLAEGYCSLLDPLD